MESVLSNEEIRRQVENQVRNNKRLLHYKNKSCVSQIESYNYICRRLCSIWKNDNDLFVIAELNELMPYLPESAKAEIKLLIKMRG